MAKYSEQTGKAVISAYNTAIDNLLSSKDPEKVLEEVGRIVMTGTGVSSGTDLNLKYLGNAVVDDNIEALVQGIALFKIDRNAGLKAITDASSKIHGKLVSGYLAGFVQQEGIKPKPSDEQSQLVDTVNQLYTDWIKPKEDKK